MTKDMSEEKDNRACCACLNVSFNPIRNEDGSYNERWTCKDCGNEFVKKFWFKSLESRLKESEEEVFIKCKQNGVLLERLSQAEAENKVLRDENVAYNKNYLKLMDVAEKLSEWVEGYIDYLGHEDCGNECQQGEMRKEMEKLIAEWDGIKKEEK